ncbi:uncharacterized protein LAESUDRAFT_724500 [Laetiporus sulphureus 93-53]|uniref:Uncharacterized protein n=1 Tax=Laetiporus sulphureus 93-53 TaxID=1314785 RepID=A0A165EZ50_9APHY|nr:uncharacterized protein LAESUDRAFT_724500 [Laetiporus sulphureus 93-53]KZT08022.1 hypothetical protein LAESUDRAFT_724500 [Laetiporus sulphureus 93-53]
MATKPPKAFAEIVLYILAVVNIVCTILLVRRLQFPGFSQDAANVSYTYIGEDYPVEYPLGQLPKVDMTLQESMHYALDANDSLSHEEWRSVMLRPEGAGRVRLGPQHRLFVMTFYHQLHCLYHIHRGLVGLTDPVGPHLHHCLNYLRQTFLCVASDALEEGDFMERDYAKNRVGDETICEDWEMMYDALDRNNAEWMEWAAQWDR